MLAGSVQVSTGTKTNLSCQDGPVFTRVHRREGPAAPRGSRARTHGTTISQPTWPGVPDRLHPAHGAGAGPATFRDPRGPHGLCGNGAECESPRSRSLCAARANALGPSGEGPRAPWPHSLQPAGASHADPTRAPQGRTSYTPSPGASTTADWADWIGATSNAKPARRAACFSSSPAIIYWQIREIDRVLSEAGSDADDLNFELLSHISPIGWDNVLLYGEYQLNRSLVRSERLSV